MPEGFRGSNERVRELCRKLKPIIGTQAERIFSAYVLEDAEGKKQIEAYVEALAGTKLSQALDETAIDLVPPSPQSAAGSYRLGTIRYNGKDSGDFGLRESEWIQHMGVFGRSGAGKTNLGFEIFRQLRRHNKPVLVFDWKRNYRDLLALPEFEDVEVYTVGRDVVPFRFNPLIPPRGTNPKTWLKRIIEVVATSYMLGDGVLYLLQETLDSIFEESGVYDGTVKKWPTFREVMTRAKERNSKGRESAWLASTLRALSTLNFGEMSNLLNASGDQQSSMERLLKKPVILEMDALSQADKVFMISALLLWIHHYRMAEGEREHFKHAIMIEEAHHVLSNERHSLIGGQSVMDITFREIREYGESIVVLDQHPSKISFSALGNSYCTICLNLKHQKDVFAMAQSMLLDGHEKDILGSLEVGQAVVKLQGRVVRPFLINIPEFPIRKGMYNDDDIRRRMGDFISEMPRVDSPGAESPSETVSPFEINSPNGVTTEELRFLTDTLEYPESGIVARYKRLGSSVRQGQRLKSVLAARGFIEEREERTNTGRTIVVRLTEKGMELLEKRRNAA